MGSPLHARLISTAIVPYLSRAGRVHSVFRGAVNIECGEELLTVCSLDVGAMPNGIVLTDSVDLRDLGIARGAEVWTSGVLLRVGRVAVDLSNAEPWSPLLQRQPRFRPRHEVGVALARALARRPVATGFAPLLREDVSPTPLVAHAQPAIREVVRAVGDNVLPDAVQAAKRLIGLGEGLTPSGDDFLIGVGAAMRAAGHPLHDQFMSACRDLARGRTTTVAESFYRHAAAGAYSARVHRLVGSLADPRVELRTEIELALDWGASSGADCLLGVLLAAEAIHMEVSTA